MVNIAWHSRRKGRSTPGVKEKMGNWATEIEGRFCLSLKIVHWQAFPSLTAQRKLKGSCGSLGRVLVSGLKVCDLETHCRHCVSNCVLEQDTLSSADCLFNPASPEIVLTWLKNCWLVSKASIQTKSAQYHPSWALCLLVLSVYNLYKQFGLWSGQTKCRVWPGSKLILWWYSWNWKIFF